MVMRASRTLLLVNFLYPVISLNKGHTNCGYTLRTSNQRLPFKSGNSVVKIIPNGDDNKVHLRKVTH